MKTKSLFLLSITFCSLLTSCTTIVWRNFTWLEHDYLQPVTNHNVEQRYSDYDWWYDHCTAYNNPINKSGHFGYVACGVSKYRIKKSSNDPTTSLTYDETDASVFPNFPNGCAIGTANLFNDADSCDYDFNNFENRKIGKLGLGFNTIGLVRPSGTTAFLSKMNYEGEYLRVKQLRDGTFLTVGWTTATRKRPEAPQNGTPLYYNPTATIPNNYFINTDIFNSTTIPQSNSSHWDIMKFSGSDGLCLFDNIYGIDEFNDNSAQFKIKEDQNTITGTNKQRAYFSHGSASDFVEDSNGNIAVVGMNTNQDLGYVDKAAIIKIDPNGNVLQKRFLNTNNPTNLWSSARAIEIGKINGQDVYLIAITNELERTQEPLRWHTSVSIYYLPINFTDSTPLNHIQTFNSNANLPVEHLTIWNMIYKDNNLFIPLITNCNNVWFSGDNFGDLKFAKIDLTAEDFGNPLITNVGRVRAFDLKARITSLSDGNFGIVSSTQITPWRSQYDVSRIPSNYLKCNDMEKSVTDFWNTNAYVIKVNRNGNILWVSIFDSADGNNDYDFPTSPTTGSGDPKRQECMYGISEAPDGDIVVSGNSSGNRDDNYMVKVKKK